MMGDGGWVCRKPPASDLSMKVVSAPQYAEGGEMRDAVEEEEEEESDVDRLPIDLLSRLFSFVSSLTDLAQASRVSKKWKQVVLLSMALRERLNFSTYKMDDNSASRLVSCAFSLKELDISRGRWGCQITDVGLFKISNAMCVTNLTSISLWGMTGITDEGVVRLVLKARSVQHLNMGGTFVTDESLCAVGRNCRKLKTIGLWSCRHVTGRGLASLVNGCGSLESVDAWGMMLSPDSLLPLLGTRRSVRIKF